MASTGYQARRARLVRAAGVGSAVVRCHEDTWKFITGYCWTKYNKFPLVTRDHEAAGEGMKEVSLSGPNLAMILTRMGLVGAPVNPFTYNRSVARRVYEAVAAVVDTLDPDTEHGDIPVIVIDDRPPPSS
ncbi:hypothetical protein ACWGDX_13320 [Streptomyces sp. NPDC055025]